MALAAGAWRPSFARTLLTMTQVIKMDQARHPEPMRGARWVERSTVPSSVFDPKGDLRCRAQNLRDLPRPWRSPPIVRRDEGKHAPNLSFSDRNARLTERH